MSSFCRKEKKSIEPITGCLEVRGEAETKDEGKIGFCGHFGFKAQSTEASEKAQMEGKDWRLTLKNSVLASLINTFIEFEMEQIFSDFKRVIATATELADETTAKYGFRIEYIQMVGVKKNRNPKKRKTANSLTTASSRSACKCRP